MIKGGKLILWICILLLLPGGLPRLCRAEPVLVSRMPAEIAERTGPNIKILEALAQKVKARLKLIRAPFKRALVMMSQGNIDIMAGLLRTPAREDYITYVYPAYKVRSDTIFFVPRGKADLIRRYEDLSSLKIGTTIGARYFFRFDRDRTLEKEAVHQIEISFRKLLAGRVDAVISSEGGGIDMMDKLDLAGEVDIARFRFSHRKPVYLGLSKRSGVRERIPTIRQAAEEMIRSGEVLRIFQDYYTRRNLPVPAM